MWLFLLMAGLYVTSFGLICHLLLSRKSQASLILWTLWLSLNPVLGIPLYLVLGTDKIHQRRLRKFKAMQVPETEHPAPENLPGILRDLGRVKRNRISQMSLPELLWGGEDFYRRLVEDIDSAETFIHFQTYVWRNDKEGRMVLAALCRAAERGVTVRVITDEMGSFSTHKEFFQPLKDAGGHFSWNSTVRTRHFRFFFNFRNHRKLTLIDGHTAYLGGMNIGKEYAGRAIGPWTDLQMRFSGPVLELLKRSFAEDWHFSTLEQLEDPGPSPDLEEGSIPVIILPSGPDQDDASYLITFQMICSAARKTLDLFTPYFVPNQHLLIAIQAAAIRGVRVRLMIPTLNEHMYMVDIGRAYYEPLLEDGVEIYELPGRVNHTKAFRVDEDLIFAGSHNLDVRSYKLNFELSLFFRSRETARKMDEVFEDLFAKSNRIELDTFSHRPLHRKIKQGFIRLFGPVL